MLSAVTIIAAAQAPYLPLVGIRLSLDQSQKEEFFRVIEDFVTAQHLRIDTANYPKQGRTVINLNMNVADDTFFHIGNFRDPDVFEIIAYSHRSREAWQRVWDALVSSLRSQFGSHRVTAWKPR